MAKVANIAINSATGAQNKTLNVGDILTVTVSFNAIVYIIGEPYVQLNIGGNLLQANYTSGSGSKWITFTYTIANGDTDVNGISIAANSLLLNGGSIQDMAGNDAILAHKLLKDNASYKVDTTAPIATLTEATLPNKVNATVQSDETGNAYLVKSNVAVNTLTDIISAADVQWNSVTIKKANANTSLSLKGLEDGEYVLYTVDNAGNLSAPANKTVTVDSTTPDASLNAAVLPNTESVDVQSTETGVAYLVKTGGTKPVKVKDVASITKTPDAKWNAVDITQANQDTHLSLAGLEDGIYTLYTADAAGNLSRASATQVTVDSSAPKISSLTVTATGAQNKLLNVGDVVTVTVNFSENVSVEGDPQVSLTIGGATVQADYSNGSDTRTLTFTYTIADGDTDPNGISIAADSLLLNGGSIQDMAGNDAILTHKLLKDNASYKVDTTAPIATLTEATLPNEANATVQSDETGNAYLVKSNVAVNTLTDIISAADVQWNSVTIKKANANTSLNLKGLEDGEYVLYTVDNAGNLSALFDKPVAVDSTAPRINTVALTSATGIQNSILNAGDTVTATVTFSETVYVTGSPQLSLIIGGTTVKANYTAGSGSSDLEFTYTILANQNDNDGIAIVANSLNLNRGTIKDTAGNAAVLAHAAVADNPDYTVDTTAPPALPLSLANDTGSSNTDNITSNGAINITGLETGATWEYSTDGNTWLTSNGTSVSLSGDGEKAISVRQIDTAGHVSNATHLTFTLDTQAPTTTLTRSTYSQDSGTLTLTGNHFDQLGVSNGTDIKNQLDWSKLIWDINGDNSLTANKTFTVADIASAIVTNATTLTITLTTAAKAALEGMTGFGSASSYADKLDVAAGFIHDLADNASSTDVLSNGVIAFNAPTEGNYAVTVHDTQSLRTAINNAQPGTTIYIAAGEYDTINISGKQHLTLLAADPDNKPHISRLNMYDTHYIDVENIVFGASRFDPLSNAAIGINASYSDNLLFIGDEIHNTRDAIGIRYSSNVEILQSYIHDNERDGINMLAVDNITISDNLFTSFHPNYENYLYQDWYFSSNGTAYLDAALSLPADHADFIQLTDSNDITITGNTLNAAGGAWTQSIFIASGTHYAPVVIEDNLISNGHRYGIKVVGQYNVEQSNNVLTHIETLGIEGLPADFAPGIEIATYTPTAEQAALVGIVNYAEIG